MYLFWLVYQNGGEPGVVLEPGPSLIHARMVAALAGLETGPFTEGHQLDAKTAKKVPKSAIGKSLSPAQARKLLKTLV